MLARQRVVISSPRASSECTRHILEMCYESFVSKRARRMRVGNQFRPAPLVFSQGRQRRLSLNSSGLLDSLPQKLWKEVLSFKEAIRGHLVSSKPRDAGWRAGSGTTKVCQIATKLSGLLNNRVIGASAEADVATCPSRTWTRGRCDNAPSIHPLFV